MSHTPEHSLQQLKAAKLLINHALSQKEAELKLQHSVMKMREQNQKKKEQQAKKSQSQNSRKKGTGMNSYAQGIQGIKGKPAGQMGPMLNMQLPKMPKPGGGM